MKLDTIACADVMDYLRSLPDESVDCCVSSPPYYGLRDYGTGRWEGGDPECDHAQEPPRFNGPKQTVAQVSGHTSKAEKHGRRTCHKCGASRVDDQLGSEPTLQEFIEKIVAVFTEVWRVLKPTGTCWLNIGDSYNAGRDGGWPGGKAQWKDDRYLGRSGANVPGLKPKDLMLIPQRLAIALQNDGWFVRAEIIWHKTNGMPESVTDRPTRNHEQIWLLTKNEKYWYDAEAIKTPSKPESTARALRGVSDTNKLMNGAPGQPPHAVHQPRPNRRQDATGNRRYTGFNARYDAAPAPMSNARSTWSIRHDDTDTPFYQFLMERLGYDDFEHLVSEFLDAQHNDTDTWTITPEPTRFAHFATFPQALVERCILAGCPEHVCAVCHAPWTRIVEREFVPQQDVSLSKDVRGANGQKPMYKDNGWQGIPRGTTAVKTLGWEPTCSCNTGTDSGIVLDPFMGSGTTALVARRLGRHYLGCDLNPRYVALARERLRMPFEEHHVEFDNDLSDLPLFSGLE